MRESIDFISKNIKGPTTYELIVDSGQNNGIKEPEFLKEVDRFQKEFVDKLEEWEEVVKEEGNLLGFYILLQNKKTLSTVIF